MKVAQNEKQKKLLGFSLYINIGNFEAFLQNLNLSAKSLFGGVQGTCEGQLHSELWLQKYVEMYFKIYFCLKVQEMK